jgi:iron-sulfur cluster assembly protein
MLTLTPTAAEAVRALVSGMDVDDETGGLRIAPGETTAQGTSLELSLVNGPEATDDAVEAGGAHVFLESQVAEILDGKVLDADVHSGRVRFVLTDGESLDADMDGGPPA